jgi:hypothetical protein
MRNNLALYLLVIIGLLGASLACGINFAGTGNNSSGSNSANSINMQLTLQSLQMTQTVSAQNQQAQPTQQQQPTVSNPVLPTPTIDNGIPCNSSKFVSESIPDFTTIQPGADFSKTWTLRNAGDCNWTTAYVFEFEEGDRLGGESVIPLSTVIEPGETITFKVNLKAPNTPGDYVGVWRLKAGDGELLGKYWFKITVPSAFKVTSVQLSFDTVSTKVKAKVTANSAGTVTYKWQVNGSTISSGSIVFSEAGTKTVSTPGPLVSGDSVKFYIDNPNHQWFGPLTVP